MSTTEIATQIAKAADGLRPGVTKQFDVHYTNQHGVPVTRTVTVGPERVDGAALRDAA